MKIVEKIVIGVLAAIGGGVAAWVLVHALLAVIVAIAMQSPASGVKAGVTLMSQEVVMVAGTLSYFKHFGDDVKTGTELGNKALAKS